LYELKQYEAISYADPSGVPPPSPTDRRQCVYW